MTLKHLSIAACLFAVACGAEQEPTSYQDMTFEQRHAYMSEVVLPEMTEIFVGFDAKYASMTCATCHGEGASDGTYAMPSPQIPRLPATEEEFFAALEDPEFERWSAFMHDEVWPEMARLLDAEVYDPARNPEGFSCSGCHMVEGQT